MIYFFLFSTHYQAYQALYLILFSLSIKQSTFVASGFIIFKVSKQYS